MTALAQWIDVASNRDETNTLRQMAGLATPMALRVAVTLGLPDRLLDGGALAAELAANLCGDAGNGLANLLSLDAGTAIWTCHARDFRRSPTAMAFPDDGQYVFPGGLAPLTVHNGTGSYWEPNVWMAHGI